LLTKQEAEKLEQEVILAVEEAVKFAKESPFPSPEEALEDIYA